MTMTIPVSDAEIVRRAARATGDNLPVVLGLPAHFVPLSDHRGPWAIGMDDGKGLLVWAIGFQSKEAAVEHLDSGTGWEKSEDEARWDLRDCRRRWGYAICW